MAFEALGPAAIAAEDERVLSPELTAGEELVWAGHPRRGLRFGGFDLGFYMVLGRLFVDSARRRKTTYGLSATRLILVTRFFTRWVPSIDLASLDTITLHEHAKGSGTIVLGAAPESRARNASLLGPAWPGVLVVPPTDVRKH